MILLILLYLLWKYNLFMNEPFSNYYKSQPFNIVKYNIKQVIQLSKLEQHPLCFNIYGAFHFIPIEEYFPLIKKNSLGSVDTILSIDNNTCDIGMVQEDVIGNIETIKSIGFSEIYSKKIPYHLKLTNIRFVCSIFSEKYTLIVRSDSNINSYSDLYNHKIGIKGSGSLYCLFNIYKYFNWGWNKRNMIYYSDNYTIINDLYKKKINAIFIVVGHPSDFITYITNNISVKIIETNDIDISKMRYFLPNIRKDVISKSYYYNSSSYLNTFSSRCMIITNKNSNVDDIYQFTKNIYNNLGFFKNNLKIFSSIFKWDLVYKIPMLEYHLGSSRFYQEQGYISSKKCSNDTTFIDCINSNKYLN